ncbi:RidA family protein [Actinomadura sp. 9N407]|uniref:RidA family protein n=1 Tax=Actinomadura sp. 9N407 TaxID=3375154 RepID=UPI0037A80428
MPNTPDFVPSRSSPSRSATAHERGQQLSVWKSFRPRSTPHPAALTLANERVIFVSGIGGHREDGTIGESAAEQARQTIANIENLLKREGSGLDEVVCISPYLVDINDIDALTAAVSDAFGDAPPAAAALVADVVLASPDMKVELEAVAVRGASRELVES